jgi:AraC-like DNA-binding protein/mannose-6-phosphate isomerase-like protein (cupin superfamily)
MVRDARAVQYEDVQRPIIAIGNEFPSGHTHPAHMHRRSQLLHAIAGTMVVSTAQGSWIVPPQQGLWVPGGVEHGFHMVGKVITRSVYITPKLARGMPAECRVLEVSGLLRQLLIEAVDIPVEYDDGSRGEAIMNLLLLELRAARRHVLAVPFPTHAGLALRCRGFLEDPSRQTTIDDWGAALAMSRRAFTRLFRSQTGLSLAEWQRQAAVLQALHKIADGEPITSVALDLGYASPAAFTSMFKRVMGMPPSRYVTQSSRKTGDGG